MMRPSHVLINQSKEIDLLGTCSFVSLFLGSSLFVPQCFFCSLFRKMFVLFFFSVIIRSFALLWPNYC